MKNNSQKWQQSKDGILAEYSHFETEKGGGSLKDENQSYSADFVPHQMKRPVFTPTLLRRLDHLIQRRWKYWTIWVIWIDGPECLALVDSRGVVTDVIYLNCWSFICSLTSFSVDMPLSMPMRAIKYCAPLLAVVDPVQQWEKAVQVKWSHVFLYNFWSHVSAFYAFVIMQGIELVNNFIPC